MSLLNARVNLIFFFASLLLSFFSRKIFLNTLGDDFIGLTGTLFSLLGFLNLAELGIGSAIGFVLYQPIFDKDKIKITEIISVMGYLYRIVGLIILSGSLILACFLPFIFPQSEFCLEIIYFAYFSFLTASLIGYFVNYKQVLLGADQRNYVVVALFQTTSIIKTLIQIGLVYYLKSYILWIVIELLFGILYAFILNKKINKVYPWLKPETKRGRLLLKAYPRVTEYIRQIFIHRIASFAQWQCLPLLINAFISLKMVAYFGNYTIVTDKVNALVNSFLGSTEAGIGNLIAEGNIQKIKQVYWESFTLRAFIAGVLSFSIFHLMDMFITLWIGSEYLLSKGVLFLLVANIFMNQINGTTAQFLFGYGLFRDTWASILQFVCCILFSSIGGFLWGLFGIMLGNTLSLFLFIFLWKPYFLFKYGFKQSIFKYIFSLVKCLFIIGIPWFFINNYISLCINFSVDTFLKLFIYILISVGIYFILVFLLLLIFVPSTKSLITRFSNKKSSI